MDYLIRKCLPKDLSKLVELCSHHALHEQAFYTPTGKEIALQEALFSDSPQLFCFVIESQNQLEGYFSFTFDFSTWDAQRFLYLDCLYLEPSFRGNGIGKAVFEKLKTIAQENNCANIQWQTPNFNQKAIQFYHRIGGTSSYKVRFCLSINFNKGK